MRTSHEDTFYFFLSNGKKKTALIIEFKINWMHRKFNGVKMLFFIEFFYDDLNLFFNYGAFVTFFHKFLIEFLF